MNKPRTTKNIREYLRESQIHDVQYPESMLTEYKHLVLYLCDKLDEARSEIGDLTKSLNFHRSHNYNYNTRRYEKNGG